MYPSRGSVRRQKRRANCRTGKRQNACIEPLEHRLHFSKAFGTYDTGFGDTEFTPGMASINTPVESAVLGQLVDDSAGRLYAGGNAGIARLTSAGAVDTGFGTAGLAALPGGDTFIAEVVDSHDRVYVLLRSSAGVAVARYASAGILDATFGQAGTAIVTSDSGFTGKALAEESDGDIVVAGTQSTNNGAGAEMRVFALKADGSPDTSFANDGSLSAQLGTSTSTTPIIRDEVIGVKILSNGDVLVGGGSVSYSNSGSSDTLGPAFFVAAEMTSTGQLVSAYGSGGIARSQFASSATLKSDGLASPPDIQLTGFDARADGSAIFAGDDATGLSRGDAAKVHDFVAAINPLGAPAYDVGWYPGDNIAAPGNYFLVDGVAALGGGGAILLTFCSDEGDAAVTSISSTGEIGENVTTFNTATDDSAFAFGGVRASFVVAPSGKIVIAAGAGGNYLVLELNQGVGFAPGFSGFADGTASSVATLDVGGGSAIEPNEIAVAYYSAKTESLMYSEELGNDLWTTPVSVGPTKGVDQYFSLQIRGSEEGGNGNPYIAYFDPASQSLKLARSSDGGQTFKTATLDNDGNVGAFASLNFNIDNNAPEVTYFDQTHHRVKFATEDSSGKWVTSTIDSNVDVTDQSANELALDEQLGFAYLDSNTGQIKLAQQDLNGKWIIQVLTKVKNGVSGLSVSLSEEADPAFVAYYDIARKTLRDVVSNGDVPVTYTAYTVASTKVTDVSAQGPSIFAYDPSTRSVIAYVQGSEPEPETIIKGSGSYLQTSDYSGEVLFAFVDSKTGKLALEAIGYFDF